MKGYFSLVIFLINSDLSIVHLKGALLLPITPHPALFLKVVSTILITPNVYLNNLARRALLLSLPAPFLPTPIMVGVAGAPSLMLSVLHTNVIARQYFILSFNVVALCFSERALQLLLNCTNRPMLIFNFSKQSYHNVCHALTPQMIQKLFKFLQTLQLYKLWWVLVVCVCIFAPQRKAEATHHLILSSACHPLIVAVLVGGNMSMWGTIRTMEGGDSSVTLVAILVLQNLYVT